MRNWLPPADINSVLYRRLMTYAGMLELAEKHELWAYPDSQRLNELLEREEKWGEAPTLDSQADQVIFEFFGRDRDFEINFQAIRQILSQPELPSPLSRTVLNFEMALIDAFPLPDERKMIKQQIDRYRASLAGGQDMSEEAFVKYLLTSGKNDLLLQDKHGKFTLEDVGITAKKMIEIGLPKRPGMYR